MQITLAIISVLTAFIAMFVAINVAYNFYSIHDFQKRLREIDSTLKNEISRIEANINMKIGEVDIQLNKFNELNKGYVDIMYQVHSANANLSFNEKRYFEAIVHELKNIYHVTKHKTDFSDNDYIALIRVKYWFIAQDILKYDEDKYINSKEDGERNKAIENNYKPLVADGILKVINGVTNLDELNNKLLIF